MDERLDDMAERIEREVTMHLAIAVLTGVAVVLLFHLS
jgi:hypothetical protein